MTDLIVAPPDGRVLSLYERIFSKGWRCRLP
jgi:hypothetical protein